MFFSEFFENETVQLVLMIFFVVFILLIVVSFYRVCKRTISAKDYKRMTDIKRNNEMAEKLQRKKK